MSVRAQSEGTVIDRERRRGQFLTKEWRSRADRSEIDLPVLGNSMLLMQFRQFCAKLLQARDLLERESISGPLQAEVPLTPVATLSATEKAIAAAENAVAVAQAEAAAAIAAALGKAAPADTAIPATDKTSPWSGQADLMAARREEVRSQLLSLLEQQSYQVMSLSGSLSLSTFREAQYVMAALADEALLNAHWTGKQGWRLLEEELFRSHASGELFFSRLDELLKLGQAGSIELAMVFYQALALDFRGKYRNNDPTRQLSRYRRQLFTHIFRVIPEAMSGAALTPQAYDVMAHGEDIRYLPNQHRWWFAVGGVLLFWLLVTFFIWNVMTSGLSHQLQRIQVYAPRGTNPLLP